MSYGEKVRFAYQQQKLPSERPLNMKYRRRMPQRSIYLVATAVLIGFFYLLHRVPTGSTTPKVRPPKSDGADLKASKAPTSDELPCRSLPGSDDVLVIMKTGSTEIQDKLPVHLNTTLRCYPHYMLFSDYEETYQGQKIYDALEFVTPKIKESHADFELWRRLRKEGRKTLKKSELSGPNSRPQATNTGKPSNPGWKLDKWKFMPMVNRTLHEYPDKKWYVFVETDTYVNWQTLLNYLKALDCEKPYYVGGQIWIGDIQFGHGGTGFAISRPALKSVVQMFSDRQAEWEEFTDKHWAGDCVLGKAMKDSGTPLTAAWPIWQGDDIGKMTWWREDGERRLWCSPSVSYHHLSPTVIESLWNFEQDWQQSTKGDASKILRYKDMFEQYVLPRMNKQKVDWDNHADEDKGSVESLDECATICREDGGCLQYALSPDMRCMTTVRPNLGDWSRGIDSGYIYERIKKWGEDQKACKGNSWIT